jgi:hypothetical protein
MAPALVETPAAAALLKLLNDGCAKSTPLNAGKWNFCAAQIDTKRRVAAVSPEDLTTDTFPTVVEAVRAPAPVESRKNANTECFQLLRE